MKGVRQIFQFLLLVFLQEVWAARCRSWIVKENKINLIQNGKIEINYEKSVVPMRCLEYFNSIKVSSGNRTVADCIKPNCTGHLELDVDCFDSQDLHLFSGTPWR